LFYYDEEILRLDQHSKDSELIDSLQQTVKWFVHQYSSLLLSTSSSTHINPTASSSFKKSQKKQVAPESEADSEETETDNEMIIDKKKNNLKMVRPIRADSEDQVGDESDHNEWNDTEEKVPILRKRIHPQKKQSSAGVSAKLKKYTRSVAIPIEPLSASELSDYHGILF
jgi:hypothetical protein